MTEDMHEERLKAVEAFGDSFVSLKFSYLELCFLKLSSHLHEMEFLCELELLLALWG